MFLRIYWKKFDTRGSAIWGLPRTDLRLYV